MFLVADPRPPPIRFLVADRIQVYLMFLVADPNLGSSILSRPPISKSDKLKLRVVCMFVFVSRIQDADTFLIFQSIVAMCRRGVNVNIVAQLQCAENISFLTGDDTQDASQDFIMMPPFAAGKVSPSPSPSFPPSLLPSLSPFHLPSWGRVAETVMHVGCTVASHSPAGPGNRGSVFSLES